MSVMTKNHQALLGVCWKPSQGWAFQSKYTLSRSKGHHLSKMRKVTVAYQKYVTSIPLSVPNSGAGCELGTSERYLQTSIF